MHLLRARRIPRVTPGDHVPEALWHTLTPAARKSASAAGTPSWSLSSMAVAPWKERCASSSACNSVIVHGSPAR
eukprot:scaffold57429_cov27-Tisochrysis_lutea.AAC.5